MPKCMTQSWLLNHWENSFIGKWGAQLLGKYQAILSPKFKLIWSQIQPKFTFISVEISLHLHMKLISILYKVGDPPL
jgi:hypothetical protein